MGGYQSTDGAKNQSIGGESGNKRPRKFPNLISIDGNAAGVAMKMFKKCKYWREMLVWTPKCQNCGWLRIYLGKSIDGKGGQGVLGLCGNAA